MEHKTRVRYSRHSSIGALVIVFVLWKTLLLCVACASPGPGYDTSTQLLLPLSSSADPLSHRLLAHVASKLVRWDAVYFINIAERGYLFEQEWAFGWGFTNFIAFAAKVVPLPAATSPLLAQAIAGSIVAQTAHLLSVLTLRALACHVLPFDEPRRSKTAFVAAVLHIFSPAGMFLTAPCTESMFSLLNFLGMLSYAKGYVQQHIIRSQVWFWVHTINSGICFGLASTVRGNGLLSGMIYIPHIVALLPSVLSFRAFFALAAIGVAAVCTLLGTLIPQYIAYQEYCTHGAIGRSWCGHMPPSIFSWVQQQYWNVGFLRYWTLSNTPLFLLAIPMLVVLMGTGVLALFSPEDLLLRDYTPTTKEAKTSQNLLAISRTTQDRAVACIRRFAAPQIALAVLALTNFHVQIINRISSGYPVWYLVIAVVLTSRNTTEKKVEPLPTQSHTIYRIFFGYTTQRVVFQAMIMYALIQGGLYASFLPPA